MAISDSQWFLSFLNGSEWFSVVLNGSHPVLSGYGGDI